MDDTREFVEMLRDPNPGVRRFALQRLSQVGDRGLIPLVRQATQDPDNSVAYQAEQSLSILMGRAVEPDANDATARLAGALPAPVPSNGGRTEEIARVPLLSTRTRGDRARQRASTADPASAEALARNRKTGLSVLSRCTRKLVEFVESPNPRIAQAAAQALGKIGDPGSCEALAAGLGREPIAQECALALASMSDPRVVDILLGILDSGDRKLVRVVLSALDSCRDERVLQRLLALTQSEDAEIRAEAVFLLGELADRAIVDKLLFLLNDTSDLVVSRTIDALRKLNYPGIVDTVVLRFADASNKRIRATLVSCLLHHPKDDRVIGLLEGALADGDPRVRANAVEAIGSLKIPVDRKLELLGRVSDDTNNRVLGNLAVALGPLDTLAALRVLTRLLNSRDKWERASAVYAAGFIREAKVGSWLASTLMFEDDEDVIRNIITSLSRFRDTAILEDLLKGLEHPRQMVRFGTARILGHMGDRSCRAAILAAVELEPAPGVKAEMITALARLSDASHVPQLARFLKDPDPRVQANTIEALDTIGAVEILPHVKPFISSLDNRVKANAAKALWTQGTLDVVSTLADMLETGWEAEVLSAIFALGEIGRTLASLGDSHRYFILASSLRERAREMAAEQPPARMQEWQKLANFLTDHWPLVHAYARGRYREALERVDELLARPPVHPAVHYLAGEITRRLEVFDRAAKHLTDAEGATQEFVGVATSLATLFHQSGDTRQSVTCHLRSLKRRVALLSQQIELALTMCKADRLDDASLMLRSLIEQMPFDSRIHKQAGGQSLRNGDLETAFEHLVYALLEDPTDARVVHDLATAAQRLGEGALSARLVGLLAGHTREGEPGYGPARDLVEEIGPGEVPS
jgi:HEAT repeat protein